MTVTTEIKTPEAQNQNEQAGTTAPSKKSSRKSILALSILALGINSTAAVYTLSPNDFALPNVANLTLPDFSRLAELLPQPKPSEPTQDPTLAVLKEIQSTQEKQFAALQANNVPAATERSPSAAGLHCARFPAPERRRAGRWKENFRPDRG